MIRLILRTGQPGEAPEERVIRDYDINDYKNKTELTAMRLKTSMYAALRAYRDIRLIERHRQGLEKIISATTEFIECDTLPQFASAILNQISVLLAIETSDIICCAITRDVKSSNQYKILATNLQGKSLSTIPAKVQTRIEEALNQHSNIQGNDYFVSYFTTRRGMENVLYVATKAPGLKRKFVNTSLRNVAKNLIPDWLICYWLTLPLSPPFAANSPTRNKLCGVCRKLIR